jgi:hypothetical protein
MIVVRRAFFLEVVDGMIPTFQPLASLAGAPFLTRRNVFVNSPSYSLDHMHVHAFV